MAFVGTEKKADFNVTSLPGKSSNHTYSLWSGTERANSWGFSLWKVPSSCGYYSSCWRTGYWKCLTCYPLWWSVTIDTRVHWIWCAGQCGNLGRGISFCDAQMTTQPPMKAQQGALHSWENKPWAQVFLASVTLQEEMCLRLMTQERIISA